MVARRRAARRPARSARGRLRGGSLAIGHHQRCKFRRPVARPPAPHRRSRRRVRRRHRRRHDPPRGHRRRRLRPRLLPRHPRAVGVARQARRRLRRHRSRRTRRPRSRRNPRPIPSPPLRHNRAQRRDGPRPHPPHRRSRVAARRPRRRPTRAGQRGRRAAVRRRHRLPRRVPVQQRRLPAAHRRARGRRRHDLRPAARRPRRPHRRAHAGRDRRGGAHDAARASPGARSADRDDHPVRRGRRRLRLPRRQPARPGGGGPRLPRRRPAAGLTDPRRRRRHPVGRALRRRLAAAIPARRNDIRVAQRHGPRVLRDPHGLARARPRARDDDQSLGPVARRTVARRADGTRRPARADRPADRCRERLRRRRRSGPEPVGRRPLPRARRHADRGPRPPRRHRCPPAPAPRHRRARARDSRGRVGYRERLGPAGVAVGSGRHGPGRRRHRAIPRRGARAAARPRPGDQQAASRRPTAEPARLRPDRPGGPSTRRGR